MQPIQSIGVAPLPAQRATTATPPGASTASFKDMLLDSLARIQTAPSTSIGEAKATFQALLQLRNGLLGAYQEIKDMRI